MVVDRQKLIEAQRENAKTYFVKILVKKNERVSGFIVTRISPYTIRFFPDEVKLNAYIADLASKDVDHMLKKTFIFSCSVEGINNPVIKFHS